MKLKIKIGLLTIFIALLASSCKNEKAEEPVVVVEEEPIVIEEEEPVELEEEVPEKIGIPSPLSGIYAEEEKVNRRPVAVMFDNHNRARWQAGLKDAEIVYEFLVEAPYTRYLGIF